MTEIEINNFSVYTNFYIRVSYDFILYELFIGFKNLTI